MLQDKLDKQKLQDIITEAVEIEKEFIIDSIPCKLIGMSDLMSEYIEFVADRLLVQLGNDKYYNSKNPFSFMEMISSKAKLTSLKRSNRILKSKCFSRIFRK